MGWARTLFISLDGEPLFSFEPYNSRVALAFLGKLISLAIWTNVTSECEVNRIDNRFACF